MGRGQLSPKNQEDEKTLTNKTSRSGFIQLHYLLKGPLNHSKELFLHYFGTFVNSPNI